MYFSSVTSKCLFRIYHLHRWSGFRTQMYLHNAVCVWTWLHAWMLFSPAAACCLLSSQVCVEWCRAGVWCDVGFHQRGGEHWLHHWAPCMCTSITGNQWTSNNNNKPVIYIDWAVCVWYRFMWTCVCLRSVLEAQKSHITASWVNESCSTMRLIELAFNCLTFAFTN